MQMKRMLVLIGSVSVALLAVVIAICNILVLVNANGKIYEDVHDIPYNRYGLLLGTSPVTTWGTHNYYFDNRIDAAVELFMAEKIDTFIVSGGDYRGIEKYGCDEPAAMRDSLVIHGIPIEKIILDYEGTRTIKSLQKVKHLGIDSIIIISQEYHNSRALYLAKYFDINAMAFNAKEPKSGKHKLKNHLREYLARVKLFIDLVKE